MNFIIKRRLIGVLITIFLFDITLLLMLFLTYKHDDSHYNRAWKYYEADELDMAFAAINVGIWLNPNNADYRNTRGKVNLAMEEYDRAITDFSEAIRLDLDNAEIWNSRGEVYLDMEEYDLAIEDFSKAIALNSDFIIAFDNRGWSYYCSAEYDLAIEDYSRAIILDPDFAQAWNGLGAAYNDKGELDRAIEDYSKAIALDSNYASPWMNRGDAYRIKGEVDRALEDYNKAIELYPDSKIALFGRGNTYRTKGEYDLAIEDYNRLIALDPDDCSSWNGRGAVFYDKGELDRAIEDYSKAIALDPDFSDPWSNRGEAYYIKGEYDRAIEDQTKAIVIDPDYDIPLYYRGRTYVKKNELDRALEDFRQSIEAAGRSNNLPNIFFRTWEFVGHFYENYPYINDRNTNDELALLYARIAMESLNRSIAKAENARSTLGSRGAEIMTSLVYHYYAGVDLEARFGSPEEAYTYSEGLRNRGFLEQMGTEAALKLPGITTEEAQRVRSLVNDVNNLQYLLSAINPQNDVDGYANAGIALTRAENELASLDAMITARVPRYEELRNPRVASLAQSQEWCGETRVVLEYVIWDSNVEFRAPVSVAEHSAYKERPSINSYCLVLAKDGVTPVRLDSGYDYADAVNRLRGSIVQDGTTARGIRLAASEQRDNAASMEQERNELYNALIKPVLQYIPSRVSEMVIVSDGVLGHLPFDVLREN